MTTGRINQVAAVARKVSRTKLGPLLPGLACPHRAAPAPAEGWHKSMGDNFFLRDFSLLFFKQIHSLFVCLFVVGIPQLSGATIHAGIRSEGLNLAPAEAMIRAAPARHF